ncbi:hypothetical protein NP493_663g02037 [Ridgeia piscesae]|uniref:C2H2-type domain-containing protein n=1 Tax=Ridgeia piscesae TaxID=27915 RepID=A0AAD9NQ09_RIDPI|nr:hypothetical protein NP493_663g02037 [Ridgeia piscesae]
MDTQTSTDNLRQTSSSRLLNKLSNQHLQMMAPTPTMSEISSIGTTPRTNAQTPMDMSTTMTSRSDKDAFLMPSHAQKQDHWTSYRVLPTVVHTSNLGALPTSHGGTVSENIISHVVSFASSNSQSPFLFPDMSPAGSIFTSPHHSASKKRAMSTSTLSSEGMDIISMIRSSPSTLFLFGSMGSLSNISPSMNQQPGTLGHLSVHNGSGSSSSLANYGVHKDVMPPCSTAAELEQGPSVDVNMVSSMSNQLVVQHGADPTAAMFYAGSYHKQEPDLTSSSVLVPATSIQQSGLPPNNVISLEASIPPPPPYSQAVQAQASTFDSLQVTDCCLESREHLDCKPKGLRQQVCKWIDCNQAFVEREELVRHIEKQHIDQRRGDDFTCYWQACQRKYKPFNARYKLLIHMRVHSGERPNKCTFENCNKAFSRLENLKIHLRSHTGERPYHCQHVGCTKAFSNSSDRAKHQRTHLDTKPYACQVGGCSKRYTDPSSLRKHTKSHSSKEQQARKKVRVGREVTYGSDNQSNMLGNCLSVQQVQVAPLDTAENSPRSLYNPAMRFGHAMLPDLNDSAQTSQSGAASSMNAVEEANHVVGGGFNPGPNSALITPGRRGVSTVPNMPPLLPLQVTKLGQMNQMMPPPPPYPDPQPSESQWQPTPNPGATPSTTSLHEQSSMPVLDDTSQQRSFTLSPRPPYHPPSNYQRPMPRPHPVSYVAQAGNVPLTTDYTGLPCNLQERMTIGQTHTFSMPLSLEETLANLPYDAIQLQRALSSHSGSSSTQDLDTLLTVSAIVPSQSEDNNLLQLPSIERSSSCHSVVSVYTHKSNR